MTDLVVLGCRTTSSDGCCRVALDVMLASPIPVHWIREYSRSVVYGVCIDVEDVL